MIFLQIYRKLNISSKLKEKYACQPLEAYSYFRASDYFYYKNNQNNSIRSYAFQIDFSKLINESINAQDLIANKNTRITMSLMNADEQASYNLAKILCNVPKKQVISDSNFIANEFNFSSITNYVIIKI